MAKNNNIQITANSINDAKATLFSALAGSPEKVARKIKLTVKALRKLTSSFLFIVTLSC